MRNFTLRVFFGMILMFFSIWGMAQNNPNASQVTSVVGKLIRVTPKLADLDPTTMYGQPLKVTRDMDGIIGISEEGEEKIEEKIERQAKHFADAIVRNTPVIPNPNTPVTTIPQSFEGQTWSGFDPSDNNLAVGPNHVIQIINNASGSIFKIWDKSGNVVQNPTTLSSLTGVGGAGDPIVMYDQLADRWVLTEFGPSACCNSLIIAVSVTANPTGSWKVYQYTDASFFPDYPKYSVWNNAAYFARTSDFNTAGTTYLGASIYAFDRQAMLAGAATATMVRVRMLDAGSVSYYYMNTIGLDGTTPSTQGGLFAVPDQASSKIDLFEFTPNFTTPASSVVGPLVPLSVNSFNAPPSTVTQPGGTGIGTLGYRMMYRLSYRNRGGIESIVMAHTVLGATSTTTDVRWYEMRRNAGNWGLYQQGNVTGADGNSRLMPGIAQDALGNIALLYNLSGTTAFPSIKYTARNECDPLGQMTLPEATVINGTVNHTVATRWGDYNTLAPDPAINGSFWSTAQYGGVQAGGSSGNDTRIANITIAGGAASFATQPVSTTVCTSTTATFSVVANGNPPITYQWQRSNDNGVTWAPITGATAAIYSFTAVTADNGSQYRCVATSSCGSGTSNAAILTITTASQGGTLSPAAPSVCGVSTASGTLTLSGQSGNVLRWESSIDGGTTWVNIANTTATLNYSVTVNTKYRALVQGAGCAASAYSSEANVTIVAGLPLSIAADPGTTLCAGDPTRLTVSEGNFVSGTLATNFASGNGNSVITFNFRNNNAFPVKISDISGLAFGAGASTVEAWYNTSSISGSPGAITNANGWFRFGTGSINAIGGSTVQPFMSGLNLTIPANTTYRLLVTCNIGAVGNMGYSTLTAGTYTFSSGGCDIVTGTNIGYGGGVIPAIPANTPRGFIGNVTFSGGNLTPVTTGTYVWSPAAGLSSTTINPVAASPAVNTTYTVTNDNGAGCVRTASIQININQRPAITTQPVSITACGNTTVTFTAAGTGTAATYQWQESTNGGASYTNITNGGIYSGATTGTLTLTGITASMNNYKYRLAVSGTCPPVANSNGATLTVAALPAVSVTPTLTCGGVAGTNGTLLTASGGNSYTWSPVAGLYTDAAATVAYTGTNRSTVYAAPSAFTAYTVTGVNSTSGCGNTATAAVNYTPTSPVINPAPANICIGNPIQMLSKAQPQTLSFGSGALNIPIIDNNVAGANKSISVSGIPAGATITKVVVKMNATHTWVGDIVVALKAPNSQVLNLDYCLSQTNNGTGVLSPAFANTLISSSGGGSLGAGTQPYTGTFSADASTSASFFGAPTGPTGFAATTAQWNALYSNPNGNWTLAWADVFPGGDVGTFSDWSIDITYTVGLPSTSPVWSPVTYLYTDPAATVPYVAGTPKDTVYVKPPTTPLPGSYTYQVTSQSLPVPAPSNSGYITINDGTATPYPSVISVAGYPATGVSVKNVTLTGISHTWSSDIDILLQSPTGQNVILMSDVGGAGGVLSGFTYVFDDAGPPMSITTANPSGTYHPTNNDVTTDNWPAPGPGIFIQAAPALSLFGSTANVNGDWKLFVDDDAAGDVGSISGGWNISFDYTFPACTSPVRTVVVTVNDSVKLVTQPVSTSSCIDKSASFSVAATGTGLTYQWQVRTPTSPSFSNVTDGGVYSGAATATLTVTAPPISMNGYQYQCVVSGISPCGGKTTNIVVLTVNPFPVVTIDASLYHRLFPGLNTTVFSTVGTPGGAYVWSRNGVTVPGASTPSLVVNIDQLGTYKVKYTDINGCSSTSNSVTISDSTNGKVFIYPNPNGGQFQVRYYSIMNNTNLPRGINVYDSRGKRVLTQKYTITAPYSRMDIDLSNFSTGVYWIEVVDASGNRLAMGRAEVLR